MGEPGRHPRGSNVLGAVQGLGAPGQSACPGLWMERGMGGSRALRILQSGQDQMKTHKKFKSRRESGNSVEEDGGS